MFKKILIFAILVICALSVVRPRHESHEHRLFGLSSKPANPKNRTEAQVCEHHNGKMCNVPMLGLKCCKDGLISKNTHCDTIGCEHDTLSLSKVSWDYK